VPIPLQDQRARVSRRSSSKRLRHLFNYHCNPAVFSSRFFDLELTVFCCRYRILDASDSNVFVEVDHGHEAAVYTSGPHGTSPASASQPRRRFVSSIATLLQAPALFCRSSTCGALMMVTETSSKLPESMACMISRRNCHAAPLFPNACRTSATSPTSKMLTRMNQTRSNRRPQPASLSTRERRGVR
jgi:hypothetical protein